MEETCRFTPDQVTPFTDIKMDSVCAEQLFTETYAEIYYRNVDWPARLVDQLRDRVIQAQGKRREETHQGRGAEDGKDRDGAADGKGERDLLRRDPLGELLHDRIANAALPEGARRNVRSGVGSGGHSQGAVKQGSADAKRGTQRKLKWLRVCHLASELPDRRRRSRLPGAERPANGFAMPIPQMLRLADRSELYRDATARQRFEGNAAPCRVLASPPRFSCAGNPLPGGRVG